MGEARIDSVINRVLVKEEIGQTTEEIKQLVALIQSVKNKSISISGSQSIAELNRLKKELDNVAKQVTTLSKTVIGEAKAREINARAALNEAKAVNETAKAKQNETKATLDSQKAKQNDAKLMDQAIDDYYQLSRAYNEAALKAKNYVLRLGENHPIAMQAVKDANDLGTVLKKLDATVGQHQRNVGNYKSAFDGLGMSFAQVARELPSLTISVQQFALAISNNLPMVADELAKAKNEIAALKAEGKDAPSLFSKITKALFGWQVVISVAIAAFTGLIGKLFSSKKATEQASKEMEDFKKELDKASKSVDDLAGRIDFLNRLGKINLEIAFGEGFDLIDLQAQFIGLQDIALKTQNELDKLKEKSDALFKQRFESLGDDDNILGMGRSAEYLSEKDLNVKLEAIEEERAKIWEKQGKNEDDQRILSRTIALQKIKDAEEFKKKQKDIADEIARLAKEAKDRLDAELQAQFNLREITLKRMIDFSKEEIENEDLSLRSRKESLEIFNEFSTELINQRATLEKKLGNKTKTEIAVIEKTKYDELIRLRREYNQMMADLDAEEEARKAEDAKKFQDRIARALKEGQEQLEKINKENEDNDKKNKDKLLKQQEDFEKKKADMQKEFAAAVTDLAFTLFTANIEREKNAIQEQIDLLEKRKQKEIEIVNQSIASSQEKAAQVALIEARANAQKEQLQQRQRQLDIRKAQFDKAQAIAQIVQQTAIGLISLIGDPNPLNKALIPLLIATSAAQLAAVVAQPIPRYAHGTDDHKGGLAYVGDGGKSEAIVLPSGQILKTPNTNTLIDLPSGSKVHSDFNDFMMKVSNSTGVPVFKESATTDTSTPLIVSGLIRVEQAVNRIPQPIIKVDNLISRRIRGNNKIR